MLIAQITDTHLGFDPGNANELNRQRLDRTLQTLAATVPTPDLLLVTGDIVEHGADGISYRRFREAIAGLPFPVHFAMGNHDSRDHFLAEFPDTPTIGGGFIQYAIDHLPVRILVLDTLADGRHGGAFCEARSAWLKTRLDEAPSRPTLIVLHHPPIETGLSWMTENPASPWIARLAEGLNGRDNVVGLIAGHLHRPVVTRWSGTLLAVCPPTAPRVALDLGDIDPEQPDERPMIVGHPPSYALHYWNGEQLITHFGIAEDCEVIARFTPGLQPLVRRLVEEKRSASENS